MSNSFSGLFEGPVAWEGNQIARFDFLGKQMASGWVRSYFERYMFLSRAKDPVATIVPFVENTQSELDGLCEGRRITCMTFCLLTLINKMLLLLREFEAPNSYAIDVISSLRACSADEVEESETSLTPEQLLTEWMADQIRFGRTRVIERFVDFQFFGYRPHVQELRSESDDFSTWARLINRSLGYLHLVHFKLFFDHWEQETAKMKHLQAMAEFSNEKCQAYRAESKLIREYLADLGICIRDHGASGNPDPQHVRERIQRVLKEKGSIAARIELLQAYKTRLHIPKYYYEQVLSEITANEQDESLFPTSK